MTNFSEQEEESIIEYLQDHDFEDLEALMIETKQEYENKMLVMSRVTDDTHPAFRFGNIDATCEGEI